MSSDDSHTVLSHSIVVAPQMSLTSTCSAPCSSIDALDQGRDLLRLEMVDLHRDALAAGGVDQLGGLLDRLGSVHLGALLPSGPAGAVHGGAGSAELDRDPSSGGPGGAGHECDLAFECLFHQPVLLSICFDLTKSFSYRRAGTGMVAPLSVQAGLSNGPASDQPRRS